MARKRDNRVGPFGGRRRFSGIESLERRRLASMSPWTAPVPEAGPAFVAAGTILPADASGTSRNDAAPANGFRDVQPTLRSMDGPDAAYLLAAMAPHDSLMPPPLLSRDDGGDGLTNNHVFLIVIEFEPSQVYAPGPALEGQDNLLTDPHVQYSTLIRDVETANRVATVSPDNGTRSSTGEVAGNLTVLQAEGHSTVSPPILGTVADREPMPITAMTNSGIAQPSLNLATLEPSDEAESTSSKAAVSHLVAFDNADRLWMAGATAAGVLADEVDLCAAASAVGELLLPQFAIDSRAISAAIGELISEADDWGLNLLGVSPDPTSPENIAFATGLVAAGLAYRQWRGGSRREEREAWRLASDRFITGPESLRLGRKV